MRITLFSLIILAACGGDFGSSDSRLRTGSALDGKSVRLADFDVRRVGPRNTIAYDETHIYWTETYALMRVSKSGGNAELVTDRLFAPSGIAIDGAHVYVAADAIDVAPPVIDYQRWPGVIARVSKKNGELEVIAREQGEPFQLAISGTHVYWMNSWTEETANAALGEAVVRRISKLGGEVETIAERQDLGDGLSVHDGAAYWTSASARGSWISGRALHRFDGAIADVPIGDDVRAVRFSGSRIAYVDRDGRAVRAGENGVEALSDATGLDADPIEVSAAGVLTVRHSLAEVGKPETEVVVRSAELLIHNDGLMSTLATWQPDRANAFLQDATVDREHAYLLVDGGVERVDVVSP